MTNGKPVLTVVEGGMDDRSRRIAISFVVYGRKRLDIPTSGLLSINALATKILYTDEGPVICNSPCVEFRLAPAFGAKLYEFTADIVGEVMEIHVGTRCVAKPVVRERLGTEPSFQILVYDLAEAEALAEVIRLGWSPKQIK